MTARRALVVFALVWLVGAAQLDAQGAGAALPPQIDQWTTVVGILLPLAVAVVNRTAWASGAKALMALLICVLAAGGDVYFKGAFSLKAWSQTALYIFFLVVTTYVGVWRPTGLADAVEKRTG